MSQGPVPALNPEKLPDLKLGRLKHDKSERRQQKTAKIQKYLKIQQFNHVLQPTTTNY
jgi:hypothetical protein